MKRYRIALGAAAVALVVVTIAALGNAATPLELKVDATQGVFGDPGTVEELGSVDTAIAGHVCTLTVDVHNNDSVRQGTDLLVSTIAEPLVVANVEAVVGDAPPATFPGVQVGAKLAASVRFGPEGSASVAATITADCPPPPTAPPTTTTTTAPPKIVPADVVVIVPPTRFTG